MALIIKTLIRIVPKAYMKKVSGNKSRDQFESGCDRKIGECFSKQMGFLQQGNRPHEYQGARAVKNPDFDSKKNNIQLK